MLAFKNISYSRRQPMVRVSQWPAVRWGLVAAVVILGILYIALTNSVATQGYKLSALQEQIDELRSQNNTIQMNITAAESLPRLQASADSIALEPLRHIEYLAATAPVALR